MGERWKTVQRQMTALRDRKHMYQQPVTFLHLQHISHSFSNRKINRRVKTTKKDVENNKLWPHKFMYGRGEKNESAAGHVPTQG